MFGKNVKRPVDTNTRLQIQDIFYTIQGEGPHSGIPAVFVRLTGCNLACEFCDTVWNDDGDLRFTPEEVVEKVFALKPKHCFLVVITGGEPLRQRAVIPLMRLLLEEGIDVQIETNGTIWHEEIPKAVDIVVSPKTRHVNPHLALRARAWKYVVSRANIDEKDGLPVGLPRPPRGVMNEDIYISPIDEYDRLFNMLNMKAAAKSCMDFGYRLMVQVHKVVGLA